MRLKGGRSPAKKAKTIKPQGKKYIKYQEKKSRSESDKGDCSDNEKRSPPMQGVIITGPSGSVVNWEWALQAISMLQIAYPFPNQPPGPL
jgi:hypothetical protein